MPAELLSVLLLPVVGVLGWTWRFHIRRRALDRWMREHDVLTAVVLLREADRRKQIL